MSTEQAQASTNWDTLRKWSFVPPHGTRFVNEQGGACTVYFQAGEEDLIFHTIFQQLQAHMQAHLSKQKLNLEAQTIVSQSSEVMDTIQNIVNEEGKP